MILAIQSDCVIEQKLGAGPYATYHNDDDDNAAGKVDK